MSGLDLFGRGAKAVPINVPMNERSQIYRDAYNRFRNAPMVATKYSSKASPKSPASRDTIRHLLSWLAPYTAHPPVLEKDIERFGCVVRSVVQAVDDDILTDEEADSVINFIADRFTRRRFDEIFSKNNHAEVRRMVRPWRPHSGIAMSDDSASPGKSESPSSLPLP